MTPPARRSRTLTHLDHNAHRQLSAVSTSGPTASQSMTVRSTAQMIRRTLRYLLRSKQAAPHLRYSTSRRVKRWMSSWSNTPRSMYNRKRSTSLLVAGARDWVVLHLGYRAGQQNLHLRQHQPPLLQLQLRHQQQQLTWTSHSPRSHCKYGWAMARVSLHASIQHTPSATSTPSSPHLTLRAELARGCS